MSSPSLLAFGEILWDVVGDTEHIGGAPFNLAAHATRCGLSARIYSRVGNDPRGQRARAELDRLQVDHGWVQHDPDRPTGYVDVRLDADGQPTYHFPDDTAWDHIEPPDDRAVATLRAQGFGALCFGTLAQRSPRSRKTLAALRDALPDVPVFYDVNLRAPFTPLDTVRDSLPGVTVIKVNEDEADILGRGWYGQALPVGKFYERLVADHGIRVLLLTRGSLGCAVYCHHGHFEIPGLQVKVASAVGAGDAFSAAFLASSLLGYPPEEAARRANRLGAWVASRPETIPDYPRDLDALLLPAA